ncbi:diacylglycerol kinase family protein [Solwaraspora sp. WMMA2080]|uniref:diacylglycerol kinase family protein n=1 Tax=unclassified Solwaraspora TaxID=2627926 RepID=UPI00248AC556|nr:MULTISPECIES: diacylglycerol kinase family protein [unclassified Solwaraspora]WBB99498.1 diacylglycerol kinase family protein [Solwaraspora sp. WMMA2059]WBC21952.1 diacylglycerol kinase family protein [Solwaraspora sp. WMMA2080]
MTGPAGGPSAVVPGSVAVLANPNAGRSRHSAVLPLVREALAATGRPVRLLTAATADRAASACRAAVDGGAAAVVTLGGDGTVHLALQALAGTDVPLGPVPTGTGNDFAACTGFPADPARAAAVIAAALAVGRSRPVDLARVSAPGRPDRWFGAVLAAGFDAVVNERANRMRWPSGPRRYDLAVPVELARLRPRRYRMVCDGEPDEFDAVLVAVGNCASYGGGMRICPAADPTDGLLDVVVAGPVTRRTLIRIKPQVRRGGHVDHPMVRSLRARQVTIDAPDLVCYADGERLGPLPVTVTAVPGALRLLW